MAVNQIRGVYKPMVVELDGRLLTPAASLKVYNHSPDGFAWGYGGSGPAQLALAILLAAGVDKREALCLHQEFKREYIQDLPERGDFALDLDVQAWVRLQLYEPPAPDADLSVTYRDGVNVERCAACSMPLRNGADEPLVTVLQSDLEDVVCRLNDCREVWHDTIKRFERVLGRTVAQIEADREAADREAADREVAEREAAQS